MNLFRRVCSLLGAVVVFLASAIMASGNIVDRLTIGNPDSSPAYRDIMRTLLMPSVEGSDQRARSPEGLQEGSEAQPTGAHPPSEAGQDVPAEVQLNELSLFVSENVYSFSRQR